MSDLLKKTSDSLIHSFLVSNLSNSLSSLIFGEWPERFAHSHSFDISDLSDSLTVAHLSWANWANHSQLLIWFKRKEQMSDEQMNKFPALHLTFLNLSFQTVLRVGYHFIFSVIQTNNLDQHQITLKISCSTSNVIK